MINDRLHQTSGPPRQEGEGTGSNRGVRALSCPVLDIRRPGGVQPRGALEARWEASREERLLLHAEAAWGMSFMVLAAAVWLWLPDIIALSL